jgi:hypothetical protein
MVGLPLFPGCCAQAALQLLLAKETRLLHTLDRLRVAAHQERRVTGRQKTLGALAQPKTWALSNGGKVRWDVHILVLLNGPLVTTVKQHTVAQPLSTGVRKTRRSVSGNFVDAEVACLQLLRATRIV